MLLCCINFCDVDLMYWLVYEHLFQLYLTANIFLSSYLSELVCHPSIFSNFGDIALISGDLFIFSDPSWFSIFAWPDSQISRVASPPRNGLTHFMLLLSMHGLWQTSTFYSISASKLLHVIGENIIKTLIYSIKMYDSQTWLGPSIILRHFFFLIVPSLIHFL